jgi:hypothetical protein
MKEQVFEALETGNIEDLKAALDKVKELNLAYSTLTTKQAVFLAEALKTNST